MSRYFNWPVSLKRFVRFDTARAEDVNAALDDLSVGLGVVEGDTNRALKLPIATADQTIALTAGQRAFMTVGFDAAGNVQAFSAGRHRGDWLTSTLYLRNDVLRDAISKNIFAVLVQHTSGVLATDIAQARLQLMVNVVDVEDARALAAASAAQAVVTRDETSAIRNTALQHRDDAALSAQAAQSAANFRGNWSALTGALSMPSSVFHASQFWALNTPVANVALEVPGVSAAWVATPAETPYIAYDNRATLRSLSPGAGDQAIVEGLGLFVWSAGSTEIDDDETCFSTASGQWILEAANWELVDAYDTVTRFGDLEFASSFASKIRTGSATCAITSVATISSASFTGTVTGAAIGDRVIATPPNQLGSTAADTALLSYHAWVSAANTVTVMLTNASAAAATTNTDIRTGWPVTVIKT